LLLLLFQAAGFGSATCCRVGADFCCVWAVASGFIFGFFVFVTVSYSDGRGDAGCWLRQMCLRLLSWPDLFSGGFRAALQFSGVCDLMCAVRM